MKLSLALLLIGLLGITSCGQKSGSSKNSKRITRITQEQIDAIINNQIFECAPLDGGGCPKGIARLLILNKENADDSGVCSGFMMGTDTLVTNQHCVSDLKDCQNTYVAIYTGSGYQKARCSSVVKILSDYPDPNDSRKKLDVAILKIDTPYEGETLKASALNLTGADTISAWVVDHTGLDKEESNLFEARITQFKCDTYNDPSFGSVMLANCPVVHGNSGSPLLDSTGDVVGIIWGGTADFESDKDLEDRRSSYERAAATDIKYFRSYIGLL